MHYKMLIIRVIALVYSAARCCTSSASHATGKAKQDNTAMHAHSKATDSTRLLHPDLIRLRDVTRMSP